MPGPRADHIMNHWAFDENFPGWAVPQRKGDRTDRLRSF